MIARWKAIDYYNYDSLFNNEITDLEVLRLIELFISDLENIKGELFINRGNALRNSIQGYELKNIYKITRYAEKWFPFDFLFKENLVYLGSSKYFLVELSPRFFLLFYYYNFNINLAEGENYNFKIFKQENEIINGVKINLIKLKILFKSFKLVSNINEMNDRQMELINEIVFSYRNFNKKPINKYDYNFSKKRDGYIEYFLRLLNKYNGLYLFSINFYIQNDYKTFNIPKIKKDFFNLLRSNQKLSSIVGYIGTWEYCKKYGYFFRVIFFVPRKKIDEPKELLDALIHLWETLDLSNNPERNTLNFNAEPSNISESLEILKSPYCVIGKKNQALISAFIESAINYTVLAEKYFFPAELQIFIFEHMSENMKKKNLNGKYVIDKLNKSFSRSFRGHLKVPKN